MWRIFDKTDTEEGTCHGQDVAQGNGQVSDQIHGVVCDIGSQQGEHCVNTHDCADQNTHSQMIVLAILVRTFFVKKFSQAPQQSCCQGKK